MIRAGNMTLFSHVHTGANQELDTVPDETFDMIHTATSVTAAEQPAHRSASRSLPATSTSPCLPVKLAAARRLASPWVLLASLAATSGCSDSSDEAPPEPDNDQTIATLNTDNYATLLEFVFTVANAELPMPLRTTIDEFYGDGVDGGPENLPFLSETSSSHDPDSGVLHQEYACSEGGSYVFSDPGSSLGGGSGVFDSCRFEGRQLNGSYGRSHELVKYVFSPGWGTTINYTAASLQSDADTTVRTLDGSLHHFSGENENSEEWSITRLTLLSGEDETVVTDATSRLYAGDQADNPEYLAGWMRSFTTNFTVRAPQTGNKTLTIVTEQSLQTDDRDTSYQTGTLRVQADDGSEIQLHLDNGDPDTFQADVSSNGTLSSFTLPWEGKRRLRCLSDPLDTETLPVTCR